MASARCACGSWGLAVVAARASDRASSFAPRRSASRISACMGSLLAGQGPESAHSSGRPRSEEHTSELQSLMRISYAVFCLKKKKTQQHHSVHIPQEESTT